MVSFEYKLLPPPIPESTLFRKDLIRRLKQRLNRRLVLVEAGAGFGKTTLFSALAQHLEMPFVWYGLDEDDRDVNQLCQGLGEGIIRRVPASARRIREALGLATQSGGALKAVIPEFFNACLRVLPEHLLLILDDFHTLDGSPEAVHLFDRIVRYAPSNLHLLVASRGKPALDGARAKAYGGVAEFGHQDLRMSEMEIGLFFRECRTLKLSMQQVEVAFRVTEGWPLAVRILQQHLDDCLQIDPDRLLDQFGLQRKTLFDSLFDDVFKSLSAPLRVFLVETGILVHLDVEVANGVLGISDSKVMLDELIRRNLFLIPVDAGGERFRYHHLFRDFLLTRLQTQCSTSELRQRHGNAAQILEKAGRWQEALHHRLEAGDDQGAAGILEASLDEILKTASADALLRWTERISTHVIFASPILLFATGWANYFKGRWSEAISRLEQALYLARQQNNPAIYAKAAYFLMALAYYGEDCVKVVQRTEEAESILDKTSPFLIPLRLFQACALMYLNRPTEAENIWNAMGSHPLVLRDGELGIRLLVLKAAHFDFPLGRFETAEAGLESALARLRQVDFQMFYGQALGFMGHLRFETGDFREAERLFEASVRDMREKGNPLYLNVAYTLLALTALCMSQLPKARRAVDLAEKSFEGASAPKLWRENDLTAAKALLALGEDHSETFFREAAKAVRHTAEKNQCWNTVQMFCLLAPAYAEAGRSDEALRLLHQSLIAAQTIGTPYGESRTRLLLASVLLDGGNRAESESHLLKALALSRTHHYDFLFLKREKHHAQKTLPLALDHEAHFAYAAFLLHRGNQEGREAILAHLQDSRDDIKLRALQAVADLGIREAERSVFSLKKEVSSPVRQAATLTLKRLRALPPLPLKVFCLGNFRVIQGNRDITGRHWRRKAAKSLFKFFVFHAGRDIPQEQLLDRFFQDVDTAKARILFHQAVSSLRTTLEPGISARRASAYLCVNGQAYRFKLPQGSVVDALCFEERCGRVQKLLDAGDRKLAVETLESALDLYRNDFLLEDVFEEWTFPFREKFSEQFNRCLWILADEHFHDHDYDLSIHYAKALLTREPWDENGTLLLMKSLFASNDRVRAVRAYFKCREALETELGIAPGLPLWNLYREIKHTPESPIPLNR